MTSEIAKKIAERIEVSFPLTDDDPNTHSSQRAFDFADGVAAVVQLICDGGINAADALAVQALYATAGQSGSHRIVSALRAVEAWLREDGAL